MMRKPMSKARHGSAKQDQGFSLIELVVAMAVFALIAVMGLQALSGMLRLRDRLGALETDVADLSYASALLRHDLQAALPLLFFPPAKAPPQSATLMLGANTGFALSLGGQPGLPPRPAQNARHRVEWRLARGQLTRRVWPTLTPAKATQRSPAAVVMTQVQDLQLRSYWVGAGWVSGLQAPLDQLTSAAAAPAQDADRSAAANLYSDALPAAIEVTLVTARFGTIVLKESLR